ncbi:MAG: hypothetical protein J6A01_12425, partial [Proteobacteria bacterium]|nr:hypothetical protein [Pseudomonadota bacterium]
SFKPTCNGNYLLECIDDQIRKVNCQKIPEYKTCMQTADLEYAQCISKKDVCSDLNDTITRKEKTEHGITDKHYQCQKASDGKQYYFYKDPRPKDSAIELQF